MSDPLNPTGMETTDSVESVLCYECGNQFDLSSGSQFCPACGGVLSVSYEVSAMSAADSPHRTDQCQSMWQFDACLPVSQSLAVSLGEGATPLISSERFSEELSIGQLLIKDEGQNPTGSFWDRGMSVASTVAKAHDVDEVALYGMGDQGHAAAAYSTRAGQEVHVFVPSRVGFTQKAMINVHGGDMTVVDGRFEATTDAYQNAQSMEEWVPLNAFETPYLQEGTKTIFYEIVTALDSTVPDAIICPVGSGVGLIGLYKAAKEWHEAQLIDRLPALYAVQSRGCAPIVDAIDSDLSTPDQWDDPDSICEELEIPNPIAGEWILEAIRVTGGDAIAIDDREMVDYAITINEIEGIDLGVAGGAAIAAGVSLSEDGTFTDDDTIVTINPSMAAKNADVLRSHLMTRTD